MPVRVEPGFTSCNRAKGAVAWRAPRTRRLRCRYALLKFVDTSAPAVSHFAIRAGLAKARPQVRRQRLL